MRSAAVFALIFVASLFLSAAADYTVVEKSGYCTRGFNSKVTDNAHTVTLTGAKQCTDSQSLGVLVFSISNYFLPWFRLIGLGAVNDTVSITVAAAAADLVFDSLIEYKETNDEPGYQPLRWNGTNWLPGDAVKKTYILGAIFPGIMWGTVKSTQTSVDGSTTAMKYTLSFSELVGWSNFDMAFSVDITTKEMRDGKRSLRPNSLKLNLDINNFKYTSTESTGLALGTIFATRGGVAKHNLTRALDEDESDEDMVDVMNDKGKRELYFSWNRTVVVDGNRAVEVKTSDWSVEVSTPAGYENQASFKLNRMWYSIDERVTSLSWDPTIGSPEGPDNSAGRAVVSLVSLLVAVLVTLILI